MLASLPRLLAAFGLALALPPPARADCPQALDVEGWHAAIDPAGSDDDVLRVSRGGRDVLVHSAHRLAFCPYYDGPQAPPLSDVTGDGAPDLVVYEYPGGMQAPLTVHVFALGERLDRVAMLTAARADFVHFEDRGGDGRVELAVLEEPHGLARHERPGLPPVEVWLRWSDDRRAFAVATDLMRRPAPPRAEVLAQAPGYRADPAWAEGGLPPPALDRDLVALVYSGQLGLARALLDASWPGDDLGRAMYRLAFEGAIAGSPHGLAVLHMGSEEPE